MSEPNPTPNPDQFFPKEGNPKIFIYCRVSKPKQDINKQFEECFKYCQKHDIIPPCKNVYYDNGTSGGIDWRHRETNKLVNLKKGNILVVPELTRLGRDVKNIMHFLDISLTNDCIIHDVKNDMILTDDMGIDLTLKTIFVCVFGEMERHMIKTRTKSAMQSDKVKENIKLSKKKNKLDIHLELIKQKINEGLNPNQIAHLPEINCNKAQMYLYCRNLGLWE